MTQLNTDRFSRTISYLRVSVTDRCNLRCFYCVPEEGLPFLGHKDVLSYEEITAIVQAGVRHGIQKVRITGGEPLVRKGIEDLVASISALPEIKDLAMTTNGVRLASMAHDLKKAGLHRVNVSLDSMKPEVFEKITGRNHCQEVKEGIEAALDAGLDPVKINVVAVAGVNDSEFADFAKLTINKPVSVRFIEYMPIGKNMHWAEDRSISSDEIREIIEKQLGPMAPVTEHGPLDGPARRFSLSGAQGEIGFINAISGHFCSTCNRLRLTADGKVRPCLFSDKEIDVRSVLRNGGGPSDLDAVFTQAIAQKPRGLDSAKSEKPGCDRSMSSIGG
ncbi:GTP 3',8-cyclase MoaA [Desulfatibacillum alkenivorans]|uniref:GTP 3',8-cyclase MoaA n=1 Tax=Desulfatibacillum alkenivorans TaxID=259354 RepID=UPI000936EAF6|nr:GTP 3',8-cyclase MoaA [Desulfatibacillum alkenivorans]